jgi:hypothetical protein
MAINGSDSDEYNKYEDRVRVSNGDPGFVDIFPTETRGDGNVRRNNYITGAAQGKGTLLRKAPCSVCGFINDLTAIDHSGGSIDGLGAGGTIALGTSTWKTSAPPSINGNNYTATESYGTQALRKNSGCALCFSKNSTKIRTLIDYVSYLNTPLTLGF